jgi:hypothetical protein
LQLKHLTLAPEAVDAVRGCLFEVRLETERRGRTRTTKADIGNKLPLGKLDQGQPMREGRGLSFSTGPKNPPAKGDNRESQDVQHVVKEGVLLLAISAPPGANELRDQRRGIEVDGTAEERIEIFESNLR